MPEKIIKKLHFKQQPLVLIMDAPPEFNTVVNAWKKMTAIESVIDKKKKYPFAIGFVKTDVEAKKLGAAITKNLGEDAVFWMAYPKKSSKKYTATISRDQGWEHLGTLGYEGVSLIAIDDDWSAFRFRKADRISTMIRRQDMAMSEKGKRKTVNKSNTAIKRGKG